MSGQPIDIRPDHEALVRDILRARLPKGVRVWAFGSRAKWLAKPYSDLDLALEGPGILPSALVADLAEDFRESDLPWKVDVLDLNAIAPSFRALIDEDRVVFSLNKKVMGEWANHRLADVIELIGGGTPKRSRPDYWGGDIPWLSVKDFNDDKRYVCSVEETITEDGLNNSSTKILKPGQIIISARGTVGALAQIAHPMAFNQSCYGINANTKFTTNDYVFYLLQGIVLNLQNIAHGAVFDTITRDTFQLVDIKLPPLPEQRAIASILGSLDDKIDLNRRMNETLEAMARVIFKDWFVDFGPTRRQTAGATDPVAIMGQAFPAQDRSAEVGTGSASGISTNKPLTAATLAPLFPASLGEDGMPERWEVTEISSLCDIKSGKRPPVKVNSPDQVNSIPVWGGNGVSWFTNQTLFDQPLIITGRVGTLGTVYRVEGNVWVSDNALCLFPHDGFNEILFQSIQMLDFKALNSGSTQPLLTQTTLKKQPCVKPSKAVADRFQDIASLLNSRIVTNQQESQTLAALRDLLLPKLMSGEIRVGGAEELVGDAG
ncbi:restriction endonuclease subunit S [Kiloniella sp.]|uniref:restriction endonuclease subunit S n=1 Tax=Kiloniella sp. TaxID=1938587 RepID=UPI003B01D505